LNATLAGDLFEKTLDICEKKYENIEEKSLKFRLLEPHNEEY